MGKKFAAAGIAAAVAVGSLGVAALDPLGVAGAQDPGAEAPAATAGERQGPLRRALDALVADGTLTQAQADAVLDATEAEAESGRAERKDRRQANRQELLATVGEVLGATPEQVKAALADGTSIAEQAAEAGVERQAVDDALTALLTGRIDAAVAEGRLGEERAATAREHVDQAVDRILDADGQRDGAGRGRGRLRPGN
jgi:hypothetical protein